mmetsp:Transcript_69/g.95  ORF Transcript_69/g.95 Transcript_69/m.95 type:complete len:87 (+) Transcript_69:1878-2138(+)
MSNRGLCIGTSSSFVSFKFSCLLLSYGNSYVFKVLLSFVSTPEVRNSSRHPMMNSIFANCRPSTFLSRTSIKISFKKNLGKNGKSC